MRYDTEELNNAPVSGAGITVSDSQSILYLIDFAIQTTTTGTLAGTLTYQASNDRVNWANLLVPAPVAVTSPSTYCDNFADAGYYYIRAQYQNTTGAGNLLIIFNGKGGS